MLCHSLFHTAMRGKGEVPVVLCLDEMGMQERFVGRALIDILAMARSQNLQLLSACQHLDQLSESLKSALLTNTAFRAFFRLGHEDARRVAQSFGSLKKTESIHVSLSVTRPGKHDPPEMARVVHKIVDMHNRPLQLSDPAWAAFAELQKQAHYDNVKDSRVVVGLLRLCDISHITRVYVGLPGNTDTMELSEYVERLPPSSFYFTGPSPIKLAVVFPKPKIVHLPQSSNEENASELSVLLQKLPVKEAYIRTDVGLTQRVKVIDVTLPRDLPDPSKFLLTGQSADEIRHCELTRNQNIAALIQGDATPTAQDVPDPQSDTPKKPSPPKQSNRSVKAVLAKSERLNPPNPDAPIAVDPPKRTLPPEPEVADDGSL